MSPFTKWDWWLHGSLRLQRVLFLGATMGGAVAVAIFREGRGEPYFVFGLATMAALVGWRLRLPDTSCSFCGKQRREVKLLIASPGVSICEECVPLSLSVMLEQGAPRWELVLAALPLRCPRAISGAVIAQVAEGQDPDKRRALLDTCFRLKNPEAGRALLEGIPEEVRTSTDWINLGIFLDQLGRYAEAIAVTQRATDSELWLLNNVAAYTLDADPERKDLEPLLADATRALLLAETLDARNRPGIRAAILGTLAELHRRMGAFEQALASVTEAETVELGSQERTLTKVKVFIAQGRAAEAKVLLEQVSAMGHPEALVTLEAKRLLSSL